MSDYPVPQSLCPRCGYHPNRASNITGERSQPKPGDVAICIDCGQVNEFGPGLVLRKFGGVASLPPKQQAMIRISQGFIRVRGRLAREESSH